jgi:signal transduction histidine kinase
MTADIAHELRTPLSIILGQIDALDDGVVPASPESFEVLREETGRLGRLVEDLRTLSRADAGELTLARRLVRPSQLLEQAQAAHQPLAAAKEVSIRVRASPDLPEINLDPDRLLQVLGNLLSNALRHAPSGSAIELSAETGEAAVVLSVQDSGPGIDPTDLPHLFDRFYRADKSRQRETGGSGLGLAIAKAIVELHGGRIWAEAAAGQGTVMSIWLPAAPG